MSDPISIYVVAVVFFAALIRATFGFGEALVSVPLLALWLPVTVASPLAVLLSVVIAGMIMLQDWKHVQMRSATGLTLAALPGIPLGVFLLAEGSGHSVKLVLGLIIIGFSLYSLFARNKLHLREDHKAWLLACGFVSGVLGGAYGMNGPPLVVYGALRRWSPQHFRATLQGYFLVASLIGLVGYAMAGLWTGTVTRYFLLSLPAVLLATVLGRIVNRRMTDHGFFRFVYAGLIVIGAMLVVEAATK